LGQVNIAMPEEDWMDCGWMAYGGPGRSGLMTQTHMQMSKSK